MVSTVGLLLGVEVFLAGGTRLKRAGETAAAIANGKSAIAAGGGDDGERGAYGNGEPRRPTGAGRGVRRRTAAIG